MVKEKVNTTSKIIIPKKEDNKKQELLDNLNTISDDDIMKIWEEIEQQKTRQEQEKAEQEQQEKEQELKKRNLDSEKITFELPNYAYEIKQNFLNLKGVDKNKLKEIDKFVSEMEEKWYIKRCSFEWWLMVMIDIPWYPTFKYFEPDFMKHSLKGWYKGRFGPYCEGIPIKFGWKEIIKNEVKYGGIWLLPMRASDVERWNFPLHRYLKKLMKENNFSFVSSQHDHKFVKILWEYYEKCTGNKDMSQNELVAMRSRVLLSWWYWLQKNERWFNSWVIECYDDNCGFNLPMLWPREFDYVSLLLTDLELKPEDYKI